MSLGTNGGSNEEHYRRDPQNTDFHHMLLSFKVV